MKNHLKYLDSLRLIACFLVVGIHTSGMDFETNLIARIFDCACGYAVPIFVTISGACFIGIITNYKKIIQKIVLLVIAYLLWSIFYLVIHQKGVLFTLRFIDLIRHLISGNYHMYYIRMIIFLYCLIPILNEIYKNNVLFIYTFVIIILYSVCFDQYKPYVVDKGIIEFFERNYFAFRPSHLVYFCLGPILRDLRIKDKNKVLITVLCLFGIFIGTSCRILEGLNRNNLFSILLGGGHMFTFAGLIYVTSIFILFKIIDNNMVSKNITKYTFGIYCIHPFVISFIFTSVLKTPTLRTTYAFIDIMINVLLVFISSLIISFVGYRIPIINKFMFLRKI